MQKIVFPILLVIGLILLSGCLTPSEDLDELVFSEKTYVQIPEYNPNLANCYSLDNPDVKDECFYNKALDLKKDFCKEIQNIDLKNTCYFELAIEISNPELCLQSINTEEYADIPSYTADLCLYRYAKEENSQKACSLIKNQAIQKMCLNEIEEID